MKKGKFQFEIRLGLALIVLVLLILNFASHYTIFRVERSLTNQVQDELNEAAVKTANRIEDYGQVDLPDSILNSLAGDYNLSDIRVIHLNYDRVLMIQKRQKLDSTLKNLDANITAERLAPVLRNESVFDHQSGDRGFAVYYPFGFAGSKYLIVVSKNNHVVGSLENAEKILLFFGALGLLITLYIATKFFRQVIDPFTRLKEKAEESGRLDMSSDDDMAQLVSSYEKIIDELRQKERELNHRMDLLSEMSGGLAHQLRNSIAAIVGFGRMIRKKASGQEKIEQNIEYLLRESHEAEALVARFLDFARPLQLNDSRFRVKDMLNEIAAVASKKCQNIEIIIDSGLSDEIILSADELLLKQAIGNLVDNACQAYDGLDGQVKIKMEVGRSNFRLHIIDEARGIPEEFQDKIFTPFFSGSPSGTGLGLPLTQKIVALHKGTLSFDSIPGKGTTFTISLPDVVVESEKEVDTGEGQLIS
jgi:signal transduction histidine kinase